MISELKGVTIRQSFIFLFVFLGSVSPGALIIFHFDRDLFIDLDSIKLIILSLAITLPVVLLNLFVASVHSDSYDLKDKMNDINKQKADEDEETDLKQERDQVQLVQLIVSFWLSAVILYFSLGLACWSGASVKQFLIYVVGGQGLAYLMTFGAYLSSMRKRKKIASLEGNSLPKMEE
ncbi:hypothetical protein KDX31_17500 [Amphritea atlantica]|uniref:Uncharacterized protein n=1 Tax=Amphritea atlantica TaxID=355243 RepID=A0ABY5GTK5_9GAMM|nr:hypothetical protein KDX31_17500 [Amphritea atlantica]